MTKYSLWQDTISTGNGLQPLALSGSSFSW